MIKQNHTTTLDLLTLSIRFEDHIRKFHQVACLKTKGGEKYFRYGLGRRYLHLSHIIRRFDELVPPTRQEPLDFYEGQNLSVLLNMLYIDVFGLLDNIAWVLAYETERIKANCLEDRYKHKIGLFKPETISSLKNIPKTDKILNKLTTLKKWFNDELDNKRHPSAHRIPLYVIPTLLSDKDTQQYYKLQIEANAYVKKGNIDEASRSRNKSYSLGKFPHMFGHEDNCIFPIYPTIIDDCNNCLSIIDEIINFLFNA